MVREPKVISYNVKGLRNNLKRKKIIYLLHHWKADIVLLQETHSCLHDEKFWRAEWGGSAFFSHGESNARGVAVFISKQSGITVNKTKFDEQGRFCMLTVDLNGTEYLIVNLYAPNQDNPAFFQHAFAQMESMGIDLKIIAGDFNTVLDLTKDITGGKGYSNSKTRNFLLEYIQENELVDIWRLRNPEKFAATFGVNSLKERLDFFLVSSALAQSITQTEVQFFVKSLSDHAPINLRFRAIKHKPGKGYWKMNNTILEDVVFCEKAQLAIKEVIKNCRELNPSERWEMIKMAIREKAIIRGAQLAKSRRNKIQVIEKKLKFYAEANNLINIPIFDDEETHIMALQTELDELLNFEVQGRILRSGARWVDLGEKPSAYFLNLEKHNHNKKTIIRLEDPQTGDTSSDADQILDILADYFKELYSNKNLDLDPDYLATLEMPQVKARDAIMMDGPIQLEEIHLALKQLKKSKCPGVDGITPECYLRFWPLLAHPLFELFNHVVSQQKLHASARDGVISLLDKPEKELLKITNWRPITLLNTDYKIFGKVLANRLQQVLPYLIHPDQSGYMKGRNISDNLLDLGSVIQHCAATKKQALIVSVDFQKAYDSLSWDALKEIMNAFGFGKAFINMVMICYTDIRSAVINNGRWSSWFNLHSGLKQGCVLSCFLFILAVEIIGLRIRQNTEIKGISIQNKQKKLGQYVDDLWNVIKYELSSFQELLFEYAEFEAFTGLSINYDKTEILRIGSLNKSKAKFYSTLPLKWSDGFIKVLGLHIHSEPEVMIKKNFDGILNKVQNICNMWINRALTPVGKIQVINSLCNSQFVYKLQCLPSPPQDFFDKYEKIVKTFVWNGRKSKIAYKRIVSSYKGGGLQLRDLRWVDKSLKLAKFHKLKESEHFWSYVIFSEFPCNRDMWLQLNISSGDAKRLIRSPFLRDMYRYWGELNFVSPVSVNDILQQILWFNSHIKHQGKWIFNKMLFKGGIFKIVHLFDLDTGRFMEYADFVTMYGAIVDFVTYYRLIMSIPQVWKNILLRNEASVCQNTNNNFLNQFLKIKTKPASFCYKFIRDKNSISNMAILDIWNNDLKTHLTEKQLQSSFVKINKITKCTKLRYFQYRILTKSLITNVRASIWDKNINNKCSFCHTEKETVIHLFFECAHVKKIWKALTKWLKYFYSVQLKLDKELCFFNNCTKRASGLINHVILITKFYIYRCKTVGSPLNFQSLVKELLKYQNIDKILAIKYDKLYKYARKWDDFDVFNE